MTPEDRITTLAEQATPGPWEWFGEGTLRLFVPGERIDADGRPGIEIKRTIIKAIDRSQSREEDLDYLATLDPTRVTAAMRVIAAARHASGPKAPCHCDRDVNHTCESCTLAVAVKAWDALEVTDGP